MKKVILKIFIEVTEENQKEVSEIVTKVKSLDTPNIEIREKVIHESYKGGDSYATKK